MKIKSTIIMYLADKKINNFMHDFDLRPKYKWYVTLKECTFTSKKPLTKKYFLNLINKSKNKEDFWIPAISYKGNLYIDPSIHELSDGKISFFIKPFD